MGRRLTGSGIVQSCDLSWNNIFPFYSTKPNMDSLFIKNHVPEKPIKEKKRNVRDGADRKMLLLLLMLLGESIGDEEHVESTEYCWLLVLIFVIIV